ncbi:fungal-specific transcription factor domain-containing protein [Chaetomidium leptoderma]|uniref:Fungal-specific transcription factor domain-containing protein n=1 Tax=Chaetomidium leptoderma TaxID=669021 RepID=A0AAN6VN98_9PEZI|nr:fungal-specific transcription factor domain-containing protein [Chaetomidium leptoderma]
MSAIASSVSCIPPRTFRILHIQPMHPATHERAIKDNDNDNGHCDIHDSDGFTLIVGDREFPRCRVCEQTAQVCDYPKRALKPGPKIGKLNRSSGTRRRRVNSKPGSRWQRKRSQRRQHLDWAQSDGEATFSTLSTRKRQDTSKWSQRRRDSRLNVHDLSFILHPTHEAPPSDKELSLGFRRDGCPVRENPSLIQQACYTIGLSRSTLEQMISIYFKKMVAISLFHEPSFSQKLRSIDSPVQICALLAALVGFAARFYPLETDLVTQTEERVADPEHYQTMALRFIDESLACCGDERPPLCIVQALIVATHCQLSRGVHGRAWRSLGMCVRLAYELNLHLVDAPRAGQGREEDGHKWRDAEEKRRAWWAMWEMDIYASTIRRTPPAVDWAQMEILLPADDADWFHDRPAPSALLERDPVKRWKVLQDSGNGSPKAWYLIISSLMKDAQVITSPRGVPWSQSNQKSRQQEHDRRDRCKVPHLGPVDEARQKLEILANAVQCFVFALPAHLEYRNQYLSFDGATAVPGRTETLQHLHCGIYNIFVLTQLARLMIYRYHLFSTHSHSSSQSGVGSTGLSGGADDGARQTLPGFNDPNSSWVRQYFEAADNIFLIVSHCCEDHIRHTNPFLPSTIWLAAAVQLVRKYAVPPASSDLGLIQSRFDVLYMTYKRCTAFWEAKTAMNENLEMLEMQLQAHYQSTDQEGEHIRTNEPTNCKTSRISHLIGLGSKTHSTDILSLAVVTDQSNRARHNRHDHLDHHRGRPVQYLPGTPPVGFETGRNHHSEITQSLNQPHSELPGLGTAAAANNSATDFMPLPAGRNHASILEPDSFSTALSPTLVPSLDDGSASYLAAHMGDAQPPHHLEWQHMELLPVDIQALLSGMSTY